MLTQASNSISTSGGPLTGRTEWFKVLHKDPEAEKQRRPKPYEAFPLTCWSPLHLHPPQLVAGFLKELPLHAPEKAVQLSWPCGNTLQSN
eukprot:2991836-Amphidinium_carterae.1